METIKTKRCAGAVIYNDKGKIFLMSSQKWKGWVVPGGEVKENEKDEEALRREIKEELGIELESIVKVGEKIKPPSRDFKDEETKFVFIDFFAKSLNDEITPNEEILDCGWFTIDEALELSLIDTTRRFIEQFRDFNKD
ncbi:MAG: NUDIX domain-containing protein [Nanoarchaeota archaeon]|nr:NUDIX domain-containing protein [Nanoarchaeota archaeon]MBU3926130.1 NUDIX domain-containing protein [Patescibacteria group bacterium]